MKLFSTLLLCAASAFAWAGDIQASSVNASASKSDATIPVYTAGTHIYVCGDVDSIMSADRGGRFVPVPVKVGCFLTCAPAEKRRFSRQQIDSITSCLVKDGTAARMIEYQKKQTASLPETERAAVLENNYIFLVQRLTHQINRRNGSTGEQFVDSVYYTAFMLFHVDDAVSSPRPVCIKSGVFGTHTDFVKFMEREVPAFAPSASVIEGKPLRMRDDFGHGFRTGDLMAIYHTGTDGSGLCSERVGYARVGRAAGNGYTLVPIAGQSGKWQNGDVAVHRQNRRNGISLEASWMPHNWSGTLGYSYLCGQNGAGLGARLLVEVGYGGSDIDKKKRVYVHIPGVGSGSFTAPVHQFYGHIGMGMPIPVASFLEITPQVMVGYSYVRTQRASFDGNFNAHYFRFPIGVTFGTNVSYPLQFLLTAGYAFNVGFNLSDMTKAANEDYKIVNKVCDELGVNIDGFYLKAGFRWNF